MSATNITEEAQRLLEKLPDNFTWDDLMHEIYVRQSIEAGLADSEAGKVVEVSEVRSNSSCRESSLDGFSSSAASSNSRLCCSDLT
jgi:hypothetical protein